MKKEKSRRDAEELLLQFKAIIHEFNNKLTVVSGGCEFIKDDNALSEQNKKMLGLVVDSCREFCTQCMEATRSIDNYFFWKRHDADKRLKGETNDNGGLPESV